MNIPLLKAEDIECRVNQVAQGRNGVFALLLLYKDARVDMRILDEVFGVMGWQRHHELIAGNLFCSILIWDDAKKTWVSKQDVGTESNVEKEKGQASDAFKRAGFNVGIGRELYTAPRIAVTLRENEYTNEGNKLKVKPWIRYSVDKIEYNDRREIVRLSIMDLEGTVRFSWSGK